MSNTVGLAELLRLAGLLQALEKNRSKDQCSPKGTLANSMFSDGWYTQSALAVAVHGRYRPLIESHVQYMIKIFLAFPLLQFFVFKSARGGRELGLRLGH